MQLPLRDFWTLFPFPGACKEKIIDEIDDGLIVHLWRFAATRTYVRAKHIRAVDAEFQHSPCSEVLQRRPIC